MASKKKLRIDRLTIRQLVDVLKAVAPGGARRKTIEEHVAEGAPRNPDGTFNLVHYAAWLKQSTAGRATR